MLILLLLILLLLLLLLSLEVVVSLFSVVTSSRKSADLRITVAQPI
jgi:hypothetical protein